jgi:hypothetical protein
MIEVPEKYALEVASPTPITSERQHEQYLSVLDKLATKDNPTPDDPATATGRVPGKRRARTLRPSSDGSELSWPRVYLVPAHPVHEPTNLC